MFPLKTLSKIGNSGNLVWIMKVFLPKILASKADGKLFVYFKLRQSEQSVHRDDDDSVNRSVDVRKKSFLFRQEFRHQPKILRRFSFPFFVGDGIGINFKNFCIRIKASHFFRHHLRSNAVRFQSPAFAIRTAVRRGQFS